MTWQAEVFKGKIGFTMEDSTPDWNMPPRPPAGSPNVLMIVLDDVGYGHLGCYGGPIETPNIDALAARGLRYTNWHTTALCSPTRSCLLTGRNHHSNGMGMISELASGYPGYDGMPKPSAPTSPRVCKRKAIPRLRWVNGIKCPRRRCPRPGRTIAGRWARVSIATTASSARRPTNSTPTWCTTTTTSNRPPLPKKAII